MELLVEQFDNGLTLLAEPMPWLDSSAFTLLLRGGTAWEPADRLGLGSLCIEMCQRGAGKRDSREIVAALDYLGVDRGASITTLYSAFSAAMLADSLLPCLDIYADIVQLPHLPPNELDDAQQMALQELLALEDDPSHRCLTELKKTRFAQPYGRTAYGERDGIMATRLEDVRALLARLLLPDRAVLAVAGKFHWDTLRQWANQRFGSWKGTTQPEDEPVVAVSATKHVPHDSSQTSIALAYDSVPYGHPEYYSARGLIGILSDGMSSRLFSEVREKRGLVYSISASLNSLGNVGSVLCFAGTTSERAQDTLEVTINTIRELEKGISEDEMRRLRTRVKTSLVMEQESSYSRSAQIATDWFHLGRVPTQPEILHEVESLTETKMLEHLERYRPSNWTLVTLGPEPLELPDGI